MIRRLMRIESLAGVYFSPMGPERAQFGAAMSSHVLPLAVILVALGLSACASAGLRLTCGMFMVFSVVFNVAAVEFIKQSREDAVRLAKARLRVDFANNMLIAFLLWSWSSSWMLLLLSPLATAAHGSRLSTLGKCGAASAALFLFDLYDERLMFDWRARLVEAAVIFSVALLVQRLVRRMRPE